MGSSADGASASICAAAAVDDGGLPRFIAKLEMRRSCCCSCQNQDFFFEVSSVLRVAPPLTNLAQVAKLFSSFCLSESPVVAVSSLAAAIDEFLLSL